MPLRRAAIVALILLPAAALCQTGPGTVPAGTPLALRIEQNYPMRTGTPLRARILYPIYADNTLLLPAGTVVTGTVSALRSDHPRRINAMLGGDFTLFRIPEVRFTQITLADGTILPFSAGTVTTGTQIYRAIAPQSTKGGFLHREFDSALNAGRGDLAVFIAPGKGDRLLQWIYGRLPYHPQRIEKNTSWTIETTSALDIPAEPAPPAAPVPPPARKPHFWEQPTLTAPPPANAGAWIVQANLASAVSSEVSKSGQPIQAIVAEPIYNADHTIAVPQGATLVGTVTRAKPARHFGRTGVLSFNFSQLLLPNAEAQTVETRLTGADSSQDIALNSEGQAKSKPQDKIAIPLFLALLASRPLDQDCGHHSGCAGNTPGKSGVGGAAGLGLVGTIVGIAGGSPNVAAGIGYWGAARAVFSRWIAPGQKITFAKDTRIVVETTARRAAPIKPNAPSAP
ncbi:MAG TPA: hypothetical protein VGN01_16235 [Acidobacteriaceae bacterium]